MARAAPRARLRVGRLGVLQQPLAARVVEQHAERELEYSALQRLLRLRLRLERVRVGLELEQAGQGDGLGRRRRRARGSRAR